MRYDYECEKCGEMEIEQSMSDDKLTECPECGSKEFEKIIKNCNFVLKDGGTCGWARDGYSSSKS